MLQTDRQLSRNTKTCSTCKKEKSIIYFGKNKSRSDGFATQCRRCCQYTYLKNYKKNKKERHAYRKKYFIQNKEIILKKQKEYYNKNKEKIKKQRKNYQTIRKYGITLKERDIMLQKQDNKCAICKNNTFTGYDWSIDHSHLDGKTRGILCNRCNSLLGMAKDNIKILENAISYLQKYLS